MNSLSIRTVDDVAGFAAVADYFSDVWRTPRTAPPLLPETLHSITHAGGAVHAVYVGERLAGGCAAVFGPPASKEVYSVLAAAERGLGVPLKRAQRAWAVEQGARTMRWTFDPLVARNARFNFVKLGGRGTEYLVDFYGPMTDGVNGGDETDRLAVTWDLTASQPVDGAAGPAARQTAPVTHTGPDGAPLAHRDGSGRYVWCRVPHDIVALRAADPRLGLSWRRAVREVFTDAFTEGFRATGMSRDGWYTLTGGEDGS